MRLEAIDDMAISLYDIHQVTRPKNEGTQLKWRFARAEVKATMRERTLITCPKRKYDHSQNRR